MFGWFRARCPVDAAAKAWIESRLRWLTDEFELHLNDPPVILPTAQFFPQRYDGSDVSIRVLFDQVCGYMHVVPQLVHLDIFTPKPTPLWLVNEVGHAVPTEAAGTYQEATRKYIVRLNEDQLGEALDLVGTMAHELAHVRLLGESRISRDVFDNELLTDLTTVFFGFGVFRANAPSASVGQMSLWPGTQLKRPEYMSLPMYGYALAHVAWWQGEPSPAWARHLNGHARAEFKASLRYLRETKDSTLCPPWEKG